MTPEQKRLASAILDAMTLARVEGRASVPVDHDPTVQAMLGTNPAAKVALDAGIAGATIAARLMIELSEVHGQDIDATLFDLRQWLAEAEQH